MSVTCLIYQNYLISSHSDTISKTIFLSDTALKHHQHTLIYDRFLRNS